MFLIGEGVRNVLKINQSPRKRHVLLIHTEADLTPNCQLHKVNKRQLE